MGYIKAINSKEYIKATVMKTKENVVKVKAEKALPDMKNGFLFFLNVGDRKPAGRYEDYVTVFREYDLTEKEYSNDGSVYIPPVIPEPEPVPEPTLEEVQETKVAEMNTAQQTVIAAGVDVQLTNGQTEHFTLTQYDQQSLMGLQTQVAEGAEAIPWHTSDEAEHCKFYSNADMKKIVDTALAYVTYHVTYFRDLRIYIRSLTDKEQVKAITYGVEIPVGYQSEPLKAMLAAQKS